MSNDTDLKNYTCCNCRRYDEADCDTDCPHVEGLQNRCEAYKKDDIQRAACYDSFIGCGLFDSFDQEVEDE